MRNNVKEIYKTRENFIVIGLTGKTGSGCSTVAQILKDGYRDYNSTDSSSTLIQNRKAEIIKKFASKNFNKEKKKFEIIKPSSLMIILFIFEKKIFFEKIQQFKNLLEKEKFDSIEVKKSQNELNQLYNIITLFQNTKELDVFKQFNDYFEKDLSEIENKEQLLSYIKDEKQKYERRLLKQSEKDLLLEINSLFNCKLESLDSIVDTKKFNKLIEDKQLRKKITLKRKIFNKVLDFLAKNKSKKFINFYENFNREIIKKRENSILSIQSLQMVGDLVREKINIFQLPEYTNLLIKAYRKKAKNKNCYIVIDSLKNPFEILYFKERYSAYYTFSIHSKDEIINDRLIKLKMELDEIKKIHKKELNIDKEEKQRSSLDSSKDFNSQNIIECIQRSDIYIDNNHDKKDTLYRQLFRYLSLIVHPGLITPSKDEMIMQLALNAKFNSGCISRQVGAVVLNKYDSVKSIGWNEVPEGQVPCLLRSHNELLNNSTSILYSKHEKNTVRQSDKFKYIFKANESNQYQISDKKGLNDSFCFKSVQNDIDNNKNQVYTRSLHAEENAFLQASKFGNSEIIGGQLFTTASPCFLCAKKAYQLGMRRIVYIEAYPDISNEQVFEIGSNKIEMVHFRGAIGLAYQKLYEPIFAYKDELKALNK